MRLKIFNVVVIVLTFLVLSSNASVQSVTENGITREEEEALIRRSVREERDVLKERKEEFKAKLNAIRDERKKVLVERIDERILAMNKNHTKRLSTVLEKLEAILNKISDRAQKLKEIPVGLNTTAVDLAIASAKTAINAAKEVVVIQSAKTYSVEITSEAKLKTNVGAVVSMFRKDLRDAHKIVIDAKQSVQKAERELALIRGEGRGKVGEDQGIRVSPGAVGQ